MLRREFREEPVARSELGWFVRNVLVSCEHAPSVLLGVVYSTSVQRRVCLYLEPVAFSVRGGGDLITVRTRVVGLANSGGQVERSAFGSLCHLPCIQRWRQH